MEDACGNVVRSNATATGRNQQNVPPKENAPAPRNTTRNLETGKKPNQQPISNNKSSNAQVMMGNARRWAEKRVATQTEAESGNGGNGNNTQQSKRKEWINRLSNHKTRQGWQQEIPLDRLKTQLRRI